MAIPSQNDFLVPFLRILVDGNSYTRGQLMFRLGKHFELSEDDLQEMSGNQFTLVSRIAWCDVHFCKAGFADKQQHPRESIHDSFRITSLGLRELHRNPAQITVGYLQSFYRGNVLRGAGADDTTSDAEVELKERLEALPPPFTVIHSVKWITHESKYGSVGEADFLIAHPQHGVLVLEVKGGEIFTEREGNSGQWYSRSRSGRVNEIHDPCVQAERSCRALHDWLEHDARTRRFRYAIFPAVALPDSYVDGDLRMDCVQDMFIDRTKLDNLEQTLLDIYAFWQRRADNANKQMDGKAAVDGLIDLAVPTRQLRPRIADIFERERRKIEELTQQQYRVLRLLRNHRRAAIVGGAGTGKTMLAMEKAQQLADSGLRVLFLCFNRHLATWLGQTLKTELIHVSTFHALVGQARNWARLPDARQLGWDEFNAQAPDLLFDAVSVMRSPDSGVQDKFFDAIIVDEAQDFEPAWWIPLPDILKDPNEGIFYIFFDDNQRLYIQVSNIPIQAEPLILDENCRNTRMIHASLTPYTVTSEETVANGPEGRPIEMIPAKDKQAVRKELQRVLHRLVNEDGIAAKEIVMLTPSSERKTMWQEGETLGNFRLSWNSDGRSANTIEVSTIYRFKGLERSVVILTEMQQAHADISDQLTYVGLSRARHHVVVIGDLPLPNPHGKHG